MQVQTQLIGGDGPAVCVAGAEEAKDASTEEEAAENADLKRTAQALQAELAGQQKKAAYRRMLVCLQVLVLLLLVLSELCL